MTKFRIIAVTTPATVAKCIEQGSLPYNQTLLTAFEHTLPFLSIVDARNVVAVLTRKRGPRYGSNFSRKKLAERIRMVERADLPKPFLDALADRMLSTRAVPNLEDELRAYKRRKKLERDMFIRFTYRNCFELQDGSDFIDHPHIGLVAVPKDIPTRSERALTMTDWIMRNKFRMHVPSARSMMNIISRGPN